MTNRVQTAFRLDVTLIKRLKRKAKANGKSLNAYVEDILEKAFPAEIEWPTVVFPKEIPDSIKELRLGKELKFSKKELEADSKLDYLVKKHVYGETLYDY